MFESPACHWCARWHDEIWPIYPKTAEARRAPLRRVNLHDPWPADLRHIRAVSFTPTFVLMADGAEVGRITGYAGEDFFWFQLSAVVQKLPEEATPEAPASNAAAGSPGGG
ncbi:thioredoxin family protein [Roseospira goensis]|uniref:Thioredoxin-related protein n=1 Tax=Roseospira goensis TaxID=391922 RepID=A0A7W6S2I3_9PROT|nr:thioredoxin family protein [Roseospira goensis]MBB4287703.1 thioredoxin-related protein [Roseospira goensis]